MTSPRMWRAYRSDYRAKEVKLVVDWIVAGRSGSVVGLAGAGRSNFLGFLCQRPDAVQKYLPAGAKPVALVPVDLNDLPTYDTATLYRVILRSFYEVRAYFSPDLQQTVEDLYRDNRGMRDPFLPQSALRELLLLLQAEQTQTVLVLDHFDGFCQQATPQMLNTLRGMRDSFKDTLSYIAGLRQQLVYLPDPASLGKLYNLFDSFVCWVGPLNEADAGQLIAQETYAASAPPGKNEIAHLIELTGGHPALLKTACHWWLTTTDKPPLSDWGEALLAEASIQYRLREIWDRLTQEEQRILSKLQAGAQLKQKQQQELDKLYKELSQQNREVLNQMVAKGLCQPQGKGWQIVGGLTSAYVAQAEGRSRGKIWLNEKTGELYQDKTLLSGLKPLANNVLRFLVENPRIRHTKTDLIISTWPDELRQEGVSDDSLYQVIMELRKQIEPNPAQPCYLVTRRGRPEGAISFSLKANRVDFITEDV